MKITDITSHVLQYDLPEELGYSQQYYARLTAHMVEVSTDDAESIMELVTNITWSTKLTDDPIYTTDGYRLK